MALDFKISDENLDVIIADKDTADFFEKVVSEIGEKEDSHELKSSVDKTVQLAANYLVSELQAYLTKENMPITDMKISAENFAELSNMIADGAINSSAAQTVLSEMFYGDDDDPSRIVEAKNLGQVSDEGELEKHVDAAIAANEQSVADFKAGKENALKFLMGQVMKETSGKANPQVIMELLQKKLS